MKTGVVPSKYKIPKFELEDIEDYYTYYVLILGVSEDVFWNCDYSFILSIMENKTAYDSYMNYVQYKENEKNKAKYKGRR